MPYARNPQTGGWLRKGDATIYRSQERPRCRLRRSAILACADSGWVNDEEGRRAYYPIDNYLHERAMWIEYRGIWIVNHHRPLSTYLRALLGAGLVLIHFDEPSASADAPASRAAGYARVPWVLVMEWLKPLS